MATLLFANFAASTLAGPISATQTTCNLAAGSGVLFPQPGSGQYFKLVFLDAATKTVREVCNATAISGDTVTIVRGQEGTTASTYAAGDVAANLITAGSFAAFAQLGSIPSNFVTGTDTGTSANTVVAATTTPTVTTPSVGQLFLITKSNNSNTGATTFQIASGTQYGVVYRDGTALAAGDWPAGSAALLYFNGGVMQYVANMGAAAVRTYFALDTGSADAITLAPVPAVAALSSNVQVIFIKGTSANATTTPTIAVSGQTATVVTRYDGTALVAGDLPAGALIKALYVPANGGTPASFRLVDLTQNEVGAATINYFTTSGAEVRLKSQLSVPQIQYDANAVADYTSVYAGSMLGTFTVPAGYVGIELRAEAYIQDFQANNAGSGIFLAIWSNANDGSGWTWQESQRVFKPQNQIVDIGRTSLLSLNAAKSYSFTAMLLCDTQTTQPLVASGNLLGLAFKF